MPRGSPFTALCRQVALLSRPVVADLHAHTTASDGDYTPSQLVGLARVARLDALAVTDHDTVAAVAAARAAAAGTGLEVVPGVECSADFNGRELHILGYFIDPADPVFVAHLAAVQARRRERFFAGIDRLTAAGVAFTPGLVETLAAVTPSLGRRHLAGLLVQTGAVESRRQAFEAYLRPLAGAIPPTHRTPAGEVVARIHAAGGLASLAHPPHEFADGGPFVELRTLGLDGVEAKCPSAAGERGRFLLQVAAEVGLVVTGGTDTHGPGPRPVGSVGLSQVEWDRLKSHAGAGRG